MLKIAWVISGLPASGKTTVGRQIAKFLRIGFLDKDDFLEALFEERGIGDLCWRRRLSDESNSQFEKAAKALDSIVLVSHWRPLNAESLSGTPTEWLIDTYQEVVEIFCDCPTEKAAARFLARSRHAGHCDKDRPHDKTYWQMAEYKKMLPLKIGSLVRIDTSDEVDFGKIISELNLHVR